MSIIDSKNFAGGGMDTDSAPELVAKNDYVSAYNVRNTGNSEGEDGYIVAIESNDIIPISLPAGLNKCIGSERFEGVRKIYKFIFNSQLKHCITEVDFDTNTETILYTNLDDSGGEDALILNPDVYVTDIKLLENQLIFRNSAGEPCLINIDRLKAGDYGVITKNDFLLIKAQPNTSPSSYYIDDNNFPGNFLSGKLFQFREQFVYDDNKSSVWGPVSNRPVPASESNPNVGTESGKNNGIVVSVDAGDDRVLELNIATRQGNLDWYLIRTVKRDFVLSLENDEISIIDEVYECYDPVTNLYSFVFFNDKLYTPVDVLETDLIQDYIPKSCEALEVINGRGDVNANSSILALAATLEGYERPVVSADITVYGVDSGIESAGYDDSTLLKLRTSKEGAADSRGRREAFYYFTGSPQINDSITIYVSFLDGVVPTGYTYSIDVTSLEANNLLATITKLKNQIASQGGVLDVAVYNYDTSTSSIRKKFNLKPGDVMLYFETRARDQNPDDRSMSGLRKAPLIRLANIGSGDIKSIPSLKLNSSYQLALAYYDEHGRAFPISTGDNFIVSTPSYAEYRGSIANISWKLNSAPPEFAKTYQWVMSPNTTHANTVYVDGIYKTGGDKGAYIEINLNTLNKYQTNNPNTTVVYDFSKGDRVAFCYYLEDEDTKIWFDGNDKQVVDVEVLDYEPIPTTVGGVEVINYILKVRKPAGLNLSDILNKVLLMEVYTPLSSVQQDENTVFFEVGERYKIEDGVHTVDYGIISRADAYFKTRNYNVPSPLGSDNLDGNYTFLVEDFNFSDFYASRYTEYGRPRTIFDTPENESYPATIRYSYEFVSKSKINQINRFYGENQVTYDLKYGAIKKMHQRDNTLICLQETKVGFVPISISIIEDQASKQNVATSTLLLNKIRYNDSGSMGIGNAVESFAEFSGVIYFVDPNRSEPIQISYGGIQSIAGKMSKFFRRTLKQASQDGVKLIGYYNTYNREYILTTEQYSGVIVEVKFNASDWEYLEDFQVDNQTLSITTPPTKGTATLEIISSVKTGKAIYTPDIGESGADSFTFSFTPVPAGPTVSKNVCINISEGETFIPSFALGEVTGQDLNTYSDESVQVGGFPITAPVPIDISVLGQYKINDGSWTSLPGYYYPGDVVVVRVLTSSSPLDSTSTTLTIGGQSAVFTATTMAFEEAGYLIVDVFTNNSTVFSANISALNTPPVGWTPTPKVYAGPSATNNSYEYPYPLGDPDNCLTLVSNYFNFSPGTDGYRFLLNIELAKSMYPSSGGLEFTIYGAAEFDSQFPTVRYATRTPDATIIVSGGSSLIPSLSGGTIILGPIQNTYEVRGVVPPISPTTAPGFVRFSYNFTTNQLTITQL